MFGSAPNRLLILLLSNFNSRVGTMQAAAAAAAPITQLRIADCTCQAKSISTNSISSSMSIWIGGRQTPDGPRLVVVVGGAKLSQQSHTRTQKSLTILPEIIGSAMYRQIDVVRPSKSHSNDNNDDGSLLSIRFAFMRIHTVVLQVLKARVKMEAQGF